MADKSNFLLSEFWQPSRVKDYKIHFARWNGSVQPLHDFARSIDDWQIWQETFPRRNSFNRQYIFSVIQIPDSPSHCPSSEYLEQVRL